MPTTIDSMTGVEIKSPFFDTAVSLELFPVHPNVLKNPNAPQKNRVALIYGSNGSGKSTIAQGFREYSESVVPKTVELNPTAGAAIIKMSSGMKSGKIFVFDEKYISRNIKVQESGLGTIVLLGEQVELEKAREDHVKEQQFLDAQRKNLQIAVEQINKSLSYIFYSDSRLKLHLENDQMYHLTVNGKDVFPDKISCGERNALALCYFFSEIAKETELQKLYHDEMFVVIDDPVSSFDVENRVGILPFLRYKLNQMLSACATTKVLMMSHDVSVIPLRKNNVQPEMSCVLCIVLIQLMCWLTFPMHGKN